MCHKGCGHGGGWLAGLYELIHQPRSSVLDGCPCSPKRTWAEKDGAPAHSTLLHAGKNTAPRARIVTREVKAFEKSVFGPCTLGEHGAPVQDRRPWFTDEHKPGYRAQLFPVCDVEGDLRTWVAPPVLRRRSSLGLMVRPSRELRGTNRHGCIAVAVVVNIQTAKMRGDQNSNAAFGPLGPREQA